MNIRQLKTMIAVAEQPSLSAAAEAIGLSHSAVSLQIKALEAELEVPLVDRSRRPPVLTDRGHALVERAREMVTLLDEIAALGSEEQLIGSLTVGVVPTAMVHLLPPALAALRRFHPRLAIHIRSGLSGDLAQYVRAGDLDVAVVTDPDRVPEGLKCRVVACEPLFVIASMESLGATAEELITGNPFIWFNRRTWAGQQIERRLTDSGLALRDLMEVDSLEAIEALVRHGLGVSIVPERVGNPFPEDIRKVPFGEPQAIRALALLERSRNPKIKLADALFSQLTDVVEMAKQKS